MDKQQGPTVEHREPYLISYDMAFPGGPVVKNLPCNAGDVGSIPGQGTKIPHVTEQLKPMCHNY